MLRLWILLVVMTVTLLIVSDADAAGRRSRRTSRFSPPASRAPSHTAAARNGGSPPYGPYQYYRDYYPKYYGGFHARDLQSIGIPTGDIGLRGNGMFYTPW